MAAQTNTTPIGRANPRALHLARALDRLEDLREAMIGRLDEIAGDPDFEPSLALTSFRGLDAGDDREGDDDFEYSLGGNSGGYGMGHDMEDDVEDHGEPSLGSQEGGPGGTRWAVCRGDRRGADLEFDEADHEIDVLDVHEGDDAEDREPEHEL